MLKDLLNSCYGTIFEKGLIQEIEEVSLSRVVEKGDLLIDIDDELTHVPLIVDGIVKIIRRDRHGDELVLYYLESGHTCAISFVNCINQNRSIFKGYVEERVTAVMIPVDYIDEWLRKYRSFRHFIIDSYHFRLLEMVDSIDNLAFLKLEDRLFAYLEEKRKVLNSDTFNITHQEIANDINSSRTVISRLLKRLEEEGKVRMHRNRLHVLS
ncbi:MAG: Crp/Fnr family transcriptional regulator [Bacteroidia bacterium]|nr:Crp/Fnr family transcriptional regulator [Bacteroidia bacterium]MBT8269533.1 Crp/Fnr family transcriptional regulator [Bacteroidia bacterium]NNK69784.1 Crp/Fnr family transcriptional regulator [Flavobacteriaceae bacterium]NNL80438.1 Crp/Fnr family transcriptional regulator [Flavobacteriaceae bacterium]